MGTYWGLVDARRDALEVERDGADLAERSLRQAAEAGHSDAHYALAARALPDAPPPGLKDRVMVPLRAAATAGCPGSAALLAELLSRAGHEDEAQGVLSAAAERGDAQAQQRVGEAAVIRGELAVATRWLTAARSDDSARAARCSVHGRAAV